MTTTTKTPEADVTPTEARDIAKEAFLWGTHPVGLYHLRFNYTQNEQSPLFTGVNRLRWDRSPMTAANRSVTTPNTTTLYGTALLDLSTGPVVILVPEIRNHYWSFQFADNYARWSPKLIGSQFNAPGPVKRLLIGPSWKGHLPAEFAGAEIIQCPSDFAAAMARIALTDSTPAEVALVNGLQDGITLMPYDQWVAGGRKPVKAENVPVAKTRYPTYPGMEQVKEPGKLKGTEFLQWVSAVLNDPTFTKQEDGYQERLAFDRFARLGLKAGQTFDPATLSPELAAAVAEGVEEGRKEATQAFRSVGVDMNGWRLATDLGYKDTDWKLRAGYGLIALMGPVPSVSHSGALGLNDSQGRPLSGGQRYTLTFSLDDLPPVTEFWEIPVYDHEGYLVANPINRYSLNSYMLQNGKLHTAGGTLVVYLQTEEPADAEQRQNWLPIPTQGGFQFATRFYGPCGALIDGSYRMPQVMRVEE